MNNEFVYLMMNTKIGLIPVAVLVCGIIYFIGARQVKKGEAIGLLMELLSVMLLYILLAPDK